MRLLLGNLQRQDPALNSSSERIPSPLSHQSQNSFHLWRVRNTPPQHASPAEPWVTALLIVTFDLDKGQIVQACLPPSALTATEQESICSHAMPDSAASGTGHEDAMYSFRLPRHTKSPGTTQLLLAHTLFRQAPDPSNPRGFFQKALVLVTSAPCLALPRTLLTLLADSAFVQGESALRVALSDLAAWPDPRVQTVSRDISVPFTGGLISVKLPHTFFKSFAAPDVITITSPARRLCLPASPASLLRSVATEFGATDVVAAGAQKPDLVRQWPLSTPSSDISAPPFHEVNLSAALHGVTDSIRVLWELLTLGEPVLVLAPTPSQCAAAVLALIGLINPLPFLGDWRPYLCIQDPVYTQLLQADDIRDVVPNGALYGMTNHHMAQQVGFPHVLTIGGADGVPSFEKQGLKSEYRPTTRRSRQMEASLTAAKDNSRVAHAAREAIFDKLTRPFLCALDRYLEPTWDEGCAITEEPYVSDPFGRPLGVIELDVESFPTADDLTAVNRAGIFRGVKRAREMYRGFVRGPVFKAWWMGQRERAARECSLLHRGHVIEACVRGTGVVGRGEDGDEEAGTELVQRLKVEIEMADEGDMALRRRLSTLVGSLDRSS